MLENRINEFVSENYEELIIEMKKLLLENTKIQFLLSNMELAGLVNKIGLSDKVRTGSGEYLKSELQIDKESKIFTLFLDNLYDDGERKHTIDAKDANTLIQKYAEFISKEKVEDRKKREKQELLKIEEMKKIEEEKAKKEKEFNDFFKM